MTTFFYNPNMDTPEEYEKRLRELRRLTAADAGALLAFMQKPTVMYAWEHGFTREDVDSWIERQTARYRTDGYGYTVGIGPNGPVIDKVPQVGIVEIGNDVYMQYKKTENGYVPLENKNVDTGFGLDRMLAFLNGLKDGYKTDLFSGAISYLENGGKLQGAPLSRVKSLYKELTGSTSMPEGFYDTVVSFLPDGKTPSEQELRKIISNLHMDGDVQGKWFGDTLFEAMRDGNFQGWLPDLTDDDRTVIAAQLADRGIPATENTMREYKRKYIMGLPMPETEEN